ncbi:MAG: FUSC family protein [Nocardioides sp.]
MTVPTRTRPDEGRRRPLDDDSRSAAPPRALSVVRSRWAEHPRVTLAMKAAAAVALAWLLIRPFGGVFDNYSYYGPFGAVVAVSSTVTRSFRSTAQAAAAIALGAATALVARELPVHEVTALALVVATGTGIAGWRRLGPMGSWVPVSALFILILGQRDPSSYLLAYLGLTTIGGLVGIAVNIAFPSLPLTPTRLALRRLRAELAEQLNDVAEGLEQPDPPTYDEWRRRRRALRPHIDRMRELAAETAEARQVNWRARRWRPEADHQHALAVVLEDLTGLTNQVVKLVGERERAEQSEPALGPALRPLTAAALAATAELLDCLDDPQQRDAALERTQGTLDDLRQATSAAWHEHGEDRYTAASLVTALERILGNLQEAC